jgi:threonyl-tRNA synthetase
VIPVGEDHRGAVDTLRRRLEAEGHRVDVDERDETVGKRIRDSELEKTPFTIVYGDRESDESLAVRERGGEQSTMTLQELLQRFHEEIATIGA